MKKLLLLSASVAAISFGSAANAQSIDYTTMQELFGEPVTTSATGKPQRASDVPVTMEILTQDDIRRSGAVDMAEVLRQVNGVNVVQKTSQQYDVAIRGYNQHNSQRLLVLVNGRQVYLDHYGYTEWSTIPVRLEEVRQIEVVKGPNTALFGFNAVNGVVNIVTFNPLYDDVSEAGVRVGTQNYREGYYVQSLKPSDKVGVRISASMMGSDAFDSGLNGASGLQTGSNKAEFNDNDRDTFNIDSMWQVSDKSQVRLEISGSNAHLGRTNSQGSLQNAEYETKSAKLSYLVDSEYGLIKANLYRNWMDWDYQTTLAGTFGKTDQSVTVAQLENTMELNNAHTLRLQAEYRDNKMTSDVLMDTDGEISYQVYAAGAMWNWQIEDNLSWTNAARVDHLEMAHNGELSANAQYTESEYDDESITEFSYNSGVVWKPSERDTLRFTTARGLEVPSLLELGLDINYGAGNLGGNPNTETAVVTNYEVAWDRRIDALDGLFRSAVFYNKTQDVKAIFSAQTGASFATDNVGDSESYGVELALEGQYNENINWGVGYIFQIIEDDLDYVNNGTIPYTKEFEDGNPQHQLNVKLGYQKGAWEADALGYYVSSSEHFYPAGGVSATFDDVDSYFGMNARVAYTFENDITLALSGQQLLESEVQTSSTPDVERRLFVTLSKKF